MSNLLRVAAVGDSRIKNISGIYFPTNKRYAGMEIRIDSWCCPGATIDDLPDLLRDVKFANFDLLSVALLHCDISVKLGEKIVPYSMTPSHAAQLALRYLEILGPIADDYPSLDIAVLGPQLCDFGRINGVYDSQAARDSQTYMDATSFVRSAFCERTLNGGIYFAPLDEIFGHEFGQLAAKAKLGGQSRFGVPRSRSNPVIHKNMPSFYNTTDGIHFTEKGRRQFAIGHAHFKERASAARKNILEKNLPRYELLPASEYRPQQVLAEGSPPFVFRGPSRNTISYSPHLPDFSVGRRPTNSRCRRPRSPPRKRGRFSLEAMGATAIETMDRFPLKTREPLPARVRTRRGPDYREVFLSERGNHYCDPYIRPDFRESGPSRGFQDDIDSMNRALRYGFKLSDLRTIPLPSDNAHHAFDPRENFRSTRVFNYDRWPADRYSWDDFGHHVSPRYAEPEHDEIDRDTRLRNREYIRRHQRKGYKRFYRRTPPSPPPYSPERSPRFTCTRNTGDERRRIDEVVTNFRSRRRAPRDSSPEHSRRRPLERSPTTSPKRPPRIDVVPSEHRSPRRERLARRRKNLRVRESAQNKHDISRTNSRMKDLKNAGANVKAQPFTYEKPLAQADACFMENHRYPVAKPLRFAIEFLTTKKIYWMRMPDEILLEPSPDIPDLSLEMAKEASNVRFMYGRPSRHPHRFLIDRKTHVIYHHHSGKGGSAYVLEPSQTLPDRFKKPFNRFTMPTYCSEEFRY